MRAAAGPMPRGHAVSRGLKGRAHHGLGAKATATTAAPAPGAFSSPSLPPRSPCHLFTLPPSPVEIRQSPPPAAVAARDKVTR